MWAQILMTWGIYTARSLPPKSPPSSPPPTPAPPAARPPSPFLGSGNFTLDFTPFWTFIKRKTDCHCFQICDTPLWRSESVPFAASLCNAHISMQDNRLRGLLGKQTFRPLGRYATSTRLPCYYPQMQVHSGKLHAGLTDNLS